MRRQIRYGEWIAYQAQDSISSLINIVYGAIFKSPASIFENPLGSCSEALEDSLAASTLARSQLNFRKTAGLTHGPNDHRLWMIVNCYEWSQSFSKDDIWNLLQSLIIEWRTSPWHSVWFPFSWITEIIHSIHNNILMINTKIKDTIRIEKHFMTCNCN